MLLSQLTTLRGRLDRLREGSVAPGGFFERALSRLARVEALPPLGELEQLDRELDRVGIHTAADVRLLRQLGGSKGRAGRLAEGLRTRAARVLLEYEERLRLAERSAAAGQPIRGAASVLERAFPRLARAVKVAHLFGEGDGAGAFEIFSARASSRAGEPGSAAVEIARFWADRAQANAHDLLGKRRDLDAAHELLLRVSSGARRDSIHGLRVQVSEARQRAHEVPAVRSLDDLVRHVRLSAKKEPKTTYKSLRALYERAVEAGDGPLAEAAHAAAAALLPPPATLNALVDRAESEALGVLDAPAPAEEGGSEALLANLAFELDAERLELFELAAGAARYFDVEDALRETVVQAEVSERRPAARRVPYPTQRLAFEVTGGLHEVNNFVLNDPRMLVYDLASNRQLVRAYLEDEPPRQPQRVKRTAVRVYVCDASGSMHGPRARFRDAILVAELNNLRQKALKGEPFDPLYFCFFNDRPTTLARVDSAAEATRQIEKLFGESPAQGQTEITLALVTAFDTIRAAAGRDPYLARATVVLVTDGEDRVDAELIRATRAPVGALDIALSFIALGEENPDLRAIAEEQRARGGRAFYQHLTDAEIGGARTAFDTQLRTLLPREVPVTQEALERLLPHLEALEQLAREEAPAAPEQSVAFDAVFPAPPEAGPAVKADEVTIGRVAELLDAIAEACALAPPDQRGGESVVLLHHLLRTYGITVEEYLALLEAPSAEVRQNLARVRLVCRPFG